MEIGLFWVPKNLSDLTRSADNYTFYTIYNLQQIDPVKYLMEIGHPTNDFSVLARWKNVCRSLNIYVTLFNYQRGEEEYWLLERTLPSGDPYSGQFTLVCSNTNIQRIAVLPDWLRDTQYFGRRGIILGNARKAIYFNQ
ncbi:MAG: hypothetical protein J6X16_02800 [Bacteroidales bacterium]|nr:hypothetical protein [Bacteroidales bacterium]